MIEFSHEFVWDAITNSAKTRFDYADFESGFDSISNDHIVDNILFMIIAGYANGDTNEKISQDINMKLLMLGCKIELGEFLSNKQDCFSNEIIATKTASLFFSMGLNAPAVMMQISQ